MMTTMTRMTTTRTGSLRLRKRELFRQLGYEPHEGQVLVHRSTKSRRVLACGSRWGKSSCAAMEVVAALLSPCAESLGWLVAPSYDLSQRIFGMVLRAVHDHHAHRVRLSSPRERRLVLTNLAGGVSEVRCKSADRESSLLGEALDWTVVDEAARLPRRIWEQNLSQRLVDRNGWALLVSTPHGPGWFHEMFRRGQRDRDADAESWSFASWTNPHIDRAAIEAERDRLSEDVFREQYGGEFIGVPPEPCPTCNGPDPDVSGTILIHGLGDPPSCPECEGAVDEDGHSMVHLARDGKPFVFILNLVPGSPKDRIPPLPPPLTYRPESDADSAEPGGAAVPDGINDGPSLQLPQTFFADPGA